MAKELEMLRLDVARLKGELAEARKPAQSIPLASSSTFGGGHATLDVQRVVLVRPQGRQAEVSAVASQNANKATVTPHGIRCQCVGCRAARVSA